jgi:hypothetical protein
MPSTGIRQQPRSMASSVRVVGLGQALQMPVGMAAGKVQAAAEGLRPATSVVEAAGIMLWVALGEEGVSVLPATGVSRAGALPRGVRGAAVVVEDSLAAVVAGAVEAVVAADAGNPRRETKEKVMRTED